MSRELAILITLFAYMVLMIAVGAWGRRRTRDEADFFLAGRTMGPFIASLSASASSSSAWTLLGVSGFAFGRGLSAVWLFPACVGGFLLNWYLVAPRLRRLGHRSGALTMTEVLASHGSRRQRAAISTVASLIILVALATYVASQFQGAGKTLGEAFGLSMPAGILIGAAIVIFYTLLGGFWAVSLTDAAQGLMMAATAVALPVGALLAIGPGDLLAGMGQVPSPGFRSLWSGMPLAAGIGFVIGLLGIGLGYPGQPHVVNRFMAMREGATEMRVARRTAIGWAAVVYAGMILLGWCARIGFEGIDDGEKAFMHVAAELFHPVVAGVMIAAVLSAVMSTADSQLLVAGASVTHDLQLGRRLRMSLLARSRAVVLLISAAAVVAALAVDETIFDRVLFAWAAMGCAFGPVLLVKLTRGPVSAGGTILSMLTGFTLSVGAYVLKQVGMLGAWAGFFERVLPFLVALVVAWIARAPAATPARR